MDYSKLDEWKRKLDQHRPLSAAMAANLREELLVRWTYHSNAIEGNTLSLKETKVVLEGITVGGRTLREHFEAINHRDAICYLEQLVAGDEPLSEWQIRSLHQLVLKNIDDEHAGKYRRINVLISGAEHIPPDALHVESEMVRLIEWYHGVAQSLHPVERAARLHADFVGIHPFVDGNGRISRLLMNLELMRSGFPAAVIEVGSRLAYYEALDQAHTQGDYQPFYELIAAAVESAFRPYRRLIRDDSAKNVYLTPRPRTDPIEGMVDLKPIRAIRPHPEKAARVVSLPYDVVDRDEARQLAQGNPDSFLRVVRSDLEFGDEISPYSDEVYDRAVANFQRLQSDGLLFSDNEPAWYIYRIEQGGHRQTGLLARASIDDYEADLIKKHEFTRREKEDDRTRHVDQLNANTGPVFLLYRHSDAVALTAQLDLLFDSTKPIYDETMPDTSRHLLVRIAADHPQSAELARLAHAIPVLYIADGHHRAASAARVGKMRREHGDHSGDYFLSVSFPDTQLAILPYNRVVKDLNGLTASELLSRIEADFEVAPRSSSGGSGSAPLSLHQIALYLDGKWHLLTAREQTYVGGDEVSALDVSILQDRILAPLLGIDDPRSSERIAFVGGVRGEEELVRLVDSGRYACAFSLYPVSTEELMSIADAGRTMPPKSTWFEPKLRSGFVVNPLK